MQPGKSLGAVLITGGCGFYGHHLIRRILEVEPTCAISVLDVDISEDTFPGVSYHQCDLAHGAGVRAIFEQVQPPPRVVFHLACPPSIVVNDQRFLRVNVEGTRHLLEASRKAGVKAFVFTSSSAVIHDNVSDLIEADETMPILKPPKQKSVYTLSKAIAEEDVLAANRKDGMLTVSLRPCTTFGPANPGFMSRIVEVSKAGKARFQMGENNPWDFVYIANVVHACLLAAHRLLMAANSPALPVGQRVEGEAFNITNDERMTFWDFTLATSAAIGKPVDKKAIVKVPRFIALLVCFLSEWGVWLFSLGRKQSNMVREGVVFAYITRTLNTDKAKRVLGYRPIVSLKDGIRESVEWYIEQDKKAE
ncbi:putative c-3 sterol dehydrogenase c-4 decarboxylase family protein [Lasiodiplodia theobromae]|uniref:C-3 sterol dehydrogenase c-4 decarboxylase family protein n=1 Tax=Lasiodiplodia theobromae TaxID=45133 RepID=A0A8H7ISW9_9PEZI|nr:putative c-3 sterol dehydrogenase c-4 decarboxylase family protein [Lasiodiplodia theobromae]